MAVTEGRILMSADDVRRSLARIAHEIIERNRGVEGVILLGIQSRGVPLARRLANLMSELEGVAIECGDIDVSLSRDDVDRHPTRSFRPTRIPGSIADARVILIDDVLFTGRTIRAAMDVIFSYGRPRGIQLAVLVDRGHRELPIRADFVGKNVPTSRLEDVRVRLTEIDGVDEVRLAHGAERVSA
ncbi:MAG: bifunctional pyr operon transcriptional regulator/uracil phosphoribosyltransferase PyrR [Chloroflexota bacterium]|nr:MAG: bifunctional pyr operon transcriptional regulator/uracil phosphoribosyltransferase PyrR [Chloroflexota bacterium]